MIKSNSTAAFIYRLINIFIGISLTLVMQSCKKKAEIKYKQKDHTAKIIKITDKADIFFDANKHDSAYFYFNKALSICDPKKNPDEYVYSLSCIAEMLQFEGDYITSESILTKTIPLLKKTTRPRYKWHVYSIMANNYVCTYDLKSALLYHQKALKYTISTLKKHQTLLNIAAVYIHQGKYDQAIKIYLPLIKKKYLDTNNIELSNRNYSVALNGLGFCYYKIGNPKALRCFNESLKIKYQIKEEEGIMLCHHLLSQYYLKSNPELAKKHAEIAYAKSNKNKYTLHKTEILSILIKCSKGSDLRKYSLKYIKLTDSINVAKNKKKKQFTLIIYESKKDKTENLELKKQKAENELQLERQKNRNFISYIIIIVAASIVLFLYFHLSLKGKKQKKEAIYNSEMRISKKLHDELANDVFTTMAFIENKNISLEENKEHLLNNLDAIYTRTRDISKENSTVITDKNYVIALKEMIAGFNTPNINLILNGLDSVNWCEIEKNKKITIYRVLQELLVNMKKHSEASLVGINLKTLDKSVSINYTDNGKGVNLNNITFKNGLHNVENRIISIGGTIDIDSDLDKGFKVYVKFPV